MPLSLPPMEIGTIQKINFGAVAYLPFQEGDLLRQSDVFWLVIDVSMSDFELIEPTTRTRQKCLWTAEKAFEKLQNEAKNAAFAAILAHLTMEMLFVDVSMRFVSKAKLGVIDGNDLIILRKNKHND
jgi:hypothetical protein